MAAAFVITAIVAVSVGFLFGGCSDDVVIPASPGLKLEPGRTYSADLDDDRAAESLLLDGDPGSLTITDGKTVYRSRDRWRVTEAHLSDIDQDGLPEVVALLDADDGRHLGMFAYFGGQYRERFVSSALSPRPLSLRISDSEGAEDVIVVTEEAGPGRADAVVLYRWNGFGFTMKDGTVEMQDGP